MHNSSVREKKPRDNNSILRLGKASIKKFLLVEGGPCPQTRGGGTHFPQQIFNFLFKPLKIQSNYLFYCNNVTYRNHIIYLSKTVGEKKN